MAYSPEQQPMRLPGPANIRLPVRGPSIARPSAELLTQLAPVSSATACAILHQLGIRQTFIEGPTTRLPGTKIIGPVLTLQFMPQREDVASGQGQEHVEKYSALWAVLEEVQPGDILAVQAYGDPYTGCFGEMLITYFKGHGRYASQWGSEFRGSCSCRFGNKALKDEQNGWQRSVFRSVHP